MGASAKKKAEKKRDFQKQTFKVGKQKPKAANFTDTSFRSKGIVLREQSLRVAAPSSGDQFSHHLLLLSSRSETQRRDSLSFLATFISSRTASERLPRPEATLFDKFLPLSLDASDGVRSQLLRVLNAFRNDEAQNQGESILRFVRVGMTHLAAGIRDTSMDILAWALKTIPEEIVTCAGGWTKTLRYFAVMLGWPLKTPSSSSSSSGLNALNITSRLGVKVLNTLGQYLRAGLEEHDVVPDPEDHPSSQFPYVDYPQHQLPKRSNPYGYLNLFVSNRSADDTMCMEREERQEIFDKELRGQFALGLSNAKKQGGELGRAAAQVEAAISEGMADFED